MASKCVEYPLHLRWSIKESELKKLSPNGFIQSKIADTYYNFQFYFKICTNASKEQICIFLHMLPEKHQYYIDCEFIVTSKSSTSTLKQEYFGRGKTNKMEIFNCPLTTFFNTEEYIVDEKFDMEMKGIFYIRHCNLPSARPPTAENEFSIAPIYFIHKENLRTNATAAKILGSVLWENEDKDFTILVNNCSISVHKQILALYSPVFAGMFKSGMKEAITNSMEIPNYPFEIVEIAVKLCYDVEVPLNEIMEYMEHVFEFIDQYQMDKIKNNLEEFLIKKINFVNVCSLANCALVAKAAKLEDACFHLLMECLNKKIAATDFETLNSEILIKLCRNSFVTFV